MNRFMPGVLAGLLKKVARLKANVLHIYHDRSDKNLPINTTCVELELETRGPDHIDGLQRELRQSGYDLEVK